jgi:hypothetical protein
LLQSLPERRYASLTIWIIRNIHQHADLSNSARPQRSAKQSARWQATQ